MKVPVETEARTLKKKYITHWGLRHPILNTEDSVFLVYIKYT